MEEKVDEVGGEEGVRKLRGSRDSLEIVARRPKWVGELSRSLNLEISSWDAILVVSTTGGGDCGGEAAGGLRTEYVKAYLRFRTAWWG